MKIEYWRSSKKRITNYVSVIFYFPSAVNFMSWLPEPNKSYAK